MMVTVVVVVEVMVGVDVRVAPRRWWCERVFVASAPRGFSIRG